MNLKLIGGGNASVRLLNASDERAERRKHAEAARPDGAAVVEVLKKIKQAEELPKTPTATRMLERMKRRLPAGVQKTFKVEKKLTRSTLLDEIAMDLLTAFTLPYFKELLIQKGKITSDMPDAEVDKRVRRWIRRQWTKAGLMEFGQRLPSLAVSNAALAGSHALKPGELFLIRELFATLLTYKTNPYTRVTGVVINKVGRPRLPPDLAAATSFEEIRDKYLEVAEALRRNSRALQEAMQACMDESLTPERKTRLGELKSALEEELQAFADVRKQHAISRRIYERLDKPMAAMLGAIINIVLPTATHLSTRSGLGLKLLPGLLLLQAVTSTADFKRTQRTTLRFIGEHHDFSSLIKEESRSKPWNELGLDDLDPAELKRFNPVTFQPIEIKKLMDEVCSAAWNDLELELIKLFAKHDQPNLNALRAARQVVEQHRNALSKSAAPLSQTEEAESERALTEVLEEIRKLQDELAELASEKPGAKAGKQAVPDFISDEEEAPEPLPEAIRQDPKFQLLIQKMENLAMAIALHAEGTPEAYRELLTNGATASTPVAKAWRHPRRLVLETVRARRRHKIGMIPALFLKTLGSRFHPTGPGVETALIAFCTQFEGHDYMLDGLRSLQGTGPSDGGAEGMFVATLAHIILVSATAIYGRRDFSYTQDYILSQKKMSVPDLFKEGSEFLKNVEAMLEDETSAPGMDSKFLEDAEKLLKDALAKGVLNKRQKKVLDEAFQHLYSHNQSLQNNDDPAAMQPEQAQPHFNDLMNTLRDFARYWGSDADKGWANKEIRSESGNTVQITTKTSGTRYTTEVPLKKRTARVLKGLPTALFSIPAQRKRMKKAAEAQKQAQHQADNAVELIKWASRLLLPSGEQANQI
ncbi:MAG TPA: hypothetical protein VEC35_13295 [Noviherbaspirillum sp.]|nr:hypothetical protein [Noviherbaspirillum sp.]